MDLLLLWQILTWDLLFIPEGPLNGLKPFALLLSSILVTLVGLHSHYDRHLWFFIVAYGLTIWSLLAISPITTFWSPAHSDYALGITCCLNLIILPRVLLFENHSLSSPFRWTAGGKSGSDSLTAANRIWNNPRMIPRATSSTPPREVSATDRLLFALRCIGKIALLKLVDRGVEWATHPIMSEVQLQDLTPDKEQTFRRLIYHGVDVDLFEVCFRLLLPLTWVWTNYHCLECFHDILAIIFVCIFRTDEPEEWPALYGDIFEAYSVKRFWGVFWHRLSVYELGNIAKPVSTRIFGQKPGSATHKSIVAFSIFFLSGVLHATVAWRLQEGYGVRDIMFYSLNFVPAAAEILLWRALNQTRVISELKARPFFRNVVVEQAMRLVGYVYVYCWLFWLVPKWQFPKLHSKRQRLLQMEVDYVLGL